MSNLLAIGVTELLFFLVLVPVCLALPAAVIYGVVKLVKHAWKD
jgi:hypothetical protein